MKHIQRHILIPLFRSLIGSKRLLKSIYDKNYASPGEKTKTSPNATIEFI